MPEPEPLLLAVLRAKNPRTLVELVSQLGLDCNCGGPAMEKGADARLDVYATRSALEKLPKRGVEVKVIADLTASAPQRLAEAGKGNRFKNKKQVPRGYGKKVKGGKDALPQR